MGKKINWDHARIYMDCARMHYAEGEEVESWVMLFEYQYETWQPEPTERQKEVQRLWQQRGLLERTKANLYAVQKEYPEVMMGATKYVIEDLIDHNIKMSKTVKERIPS